MRTKTFRRGLGVGVAIGLIGVVSGLSGCRMVSRLQGESNTLALASRDESQTLAPVYTTAVYLPVDPQTAEVYLTDLPVERLIDAKDSLSDLAGSLVHMHVFLLPRAGETPIDWTACNLTMRHLLLAGDAAGGGSGAGTAKGPTMGLYSGGGFVLPDDSIGGNRFGGSVSGVAHRLTRSTPGFNDLLGSGTATGKFDAVRDDAAAQAMSARFETLERKLGIRVEDGGKAAEKKGMLGGE